MVTGYSSRLRKQRRMYNTLAYVRDKLKANDMGEIRDKFDELWEINGKLTKDNIKLQDKCESILSQLGKKIGNKRIIRYRSDYSFTSQQGVLYFDKRYIGKWVIVMEKR